MFRFAFLQVATVLQFVVDATPQVGGLNFLGNLAGPGLQLVDSKPLKPVFRSSAKRTILRYGPLDLVGKDMKKPAGQYLSLDPKGQGGISTISKGLCSDCTILAARWSLSYKDWQDATPASGVYIHHIISFDTSKPPSSPIGSCNGSTGASLLSSLASFVDRGEDSGDSPTVFTTPDGKYNSGFHFGKNHKITVQHDIVNYDNVSKEVYINLDVEYVDGIVGADAGASLKSVTGCGILVPEINPTGPAVTTGKRMPVLKDATIISARGHLHAGGDKMTFMVNDKEVCVSVPTYDKDGVIVDMSLCPNPIPVKKGDYVTLSSTYDLTKHPLRKSTDGVGQAHSALGGVDVMGMFGITYTTD